MSEKIETSELIYEVRARKIQPSQIFTRSELQEDPDFSKVIKAEVDYQLWKRDQEAEEETNQQLDEEIKKEEKLKEENELIPGYEEKKKKDQEENELIPSSDNNAEDENENELIPE